MKKNQPLAFYTIVATIGIFIRLCNYNVPYANWTLVYVLIYLILAVLAYISAEYVKKTHKDIKEKSENIGVKMEADEYLPKSAKALSFLTLTNIINALALLWGMQAFPYMFSVPGFILLVIQQVFDIVAITYIEMFVNENYDVKSAFFMWILITFQILLSMIIVQNILCEKHGDNTNDYYLYLDGALFIYYLYRYYIVSTLNVKKMEAIDDKSAVS